MNESRKRVIGYSRVSTDAQFINGHSINIQKEKMENYCKFKNLELLNIFEEAKSGKNMNNRPMLQEIIRRLKLPDDNKLSIDGIIVAKLDRLGRDAKEIILLTDDIIKMKKNLYCVDMDLDFNSMTGQFLRTIFSAFAQLEREMIANRTKEAMAYKRARNERIGVVPMGYKLEKDITTGKNKMVPNLHERQIICRALELRTEHKWVWRKNQYRRLPLSYADIAKIMASENLLTRSDKPFTASMIFKMCKSGTKAAFKEEPTTNDLLIAAKQNTILPI